MIALRKCCASPTKALNMLRKLPSRLWTHTWRILATRVAIAFDATSVLRAPQNNSSPASGNLSPGQFKG